MKAAGLCLPGCPQESLVQCPALAMTTAVALTDRCHEHEQRHYLCCPHHVQVAVFAEEPLVCLLQLMFQDYALPHPEVLEEEQIFFQG